MVVSRIVAVGVVVEDVDGKSSHFLLGAGAQHGILSVWQGSYHHITIIYKTTEFLYSQLGFRFSSISFSTSNPTTLWIPRFFGIPILIC